MMKFVAILIAAITLVGCQTVPEGSVAGGECKIVNVPTYAVRGKTSYDQGWIDDTTEAIVRGCKMARPKARPASLDAAVVAAPAPTAKPIQVKLKWWQKVMQR